MNINVIGRWSRRFFLAGLLVSGFFSLLTERAFGQTGCVNLECYHRNLGQLSSQEFARMMQLEKEEREREQAQREHEQQQRYQEQLKVQAQQAEQQKLEQEQQRERMRSEQDHQQALRAKQDQEQQKLLEQSKKESTERQKRANKLILEGGYTRITIDYFLIGGDQLSEKKSQIALEGIYRQAQNGFTGYLFPIIQSTGVATLIGAASVFNDTSRAVPLIAQSADRDAKQFLLEKCEQVCVIVVLGSADTCTAEGRSASFPCVQVQNVLEK